MKFSVNLDPVKQQLMMPQPCFGQAVLPKEGAAQEDAEASAPATVPAAPASWRERTLRLGGSWVGFTGLYAVTGGGACPFCGQPSCPTGFLGAGIVGGVLALGLQAWREKRAWRERRAGQERPK